MTLAMAEYAHNIRWIRIIPIIALVLVLHVRFKSGIAKATRRGLTRLLNVSYCLTGV